MFLHRVNHCLYTWLILVCFNSNNKVYWGPDMHQASKVILKTLQARLQQYWTMSFQMFKLVLEKAKEPEIKLPTSAGSSKKQESSRKKSISALLTMPKPLTVWITINCGKFWKRWEYQTTWLASWETYMQVRKQQLELDIEQQMIPNRKRSTSRLYIVTPVYLTYMQRNAGLDEAHARIKIARRNINNLRYADDTTLTAESEEELKSLLLKVKEESEKVGLKLNIQKTKIMVSGPITSWQIDRETETVADFIFLGSKITADGDRSHEMKRCLLLGRKVMTNLDRILKSRDITLSLSSQGYGFSSGHVWMWELDYKESWVPKNWCFWTVVLEKIIESPLDCKEIQPVHPKGNRSWVFIGRTDVEAESPVLWPPDTKGWLIGKDPDAGKDWGQEEKGDGRG